MATRKSKAQIDAEAQPAEQPPFNGLLVGREYQEGALNITVNTAGDVGVAEVLTILEVAAKNVRAQLGLNAPSN